MKNVSIESSGGKKLYRWVEENCAFTENPFNNNNNNIYMYI
jgi:hypothetical protein